MHRPAAIRFIPLLALLLVPACSEPRAPLGVVRLEPTGDTLLTPYGDVARAAVLGPGRFVVVAPQDRAVSLADFTRHRLSSFAGPSARELEQPYDLFRSGDSLYVADWLRRRLTSWSLAGALGGAHPAVDLFRGALPRARDAAGRWYFELRSPPGANGSGNRDSAAIVRAPPDMRGMDTVVRLAPPDLVEVLAEGRRRLEHRLLSGQDRWGVLPDGSVWVARVVQNRVDWLSPDGRLAEGEGLPDRVLPVTEPDREVFLSKFEPGLRSTVAQTPFAAVKPPFEDVLTDPDGILWVVKNRAIGDTIRYYQLVDRGGRHIAESSHGGLGRMLAVGDSLALVAEPFADGTRLLLFRRAAPTVE